MKKGTWDDRLSCTLWSHGPASVQTARICCELSMDYRFASRKVWSHWARNYISQLTWNFVKFVICCDCGKLGQWVNVSVTAWRVAKIGLQGGYDLLVGTSEHGTRSASADLKLPSHKHLLLAFGGPLGLENAFAQDESTKEVPAKYFDMYINTCAEQGSRTIRTEEAILISLAYLQPALNVPWFDPLECVRCQTLPD